MKYCPLLFAWLMSLAAHAQYEQPLYVWARNGLVLREAPSLRAGRIKTLAYGAEVSVLHFIAQDSVVLIPAYKRGEEPLTSPYYLNGSWVKAFSGRDTGFLFNGYLSTMPPYKPGNPQEQIEPSIEKWLLQHNTVLDTRRRSYENYTTVYSNHVIKRYAGSEGGGSERFVFPQNRSFLDGLLLLNYFSNFRFDKKDLENCEHLLIEAHPNYLRFESVGLDGRIFWEFMIYFDGEMLVIEEGAGC